ncbi:uncharacterized protein LOC109716550 isoform X2 [Ananas comosus]|uniref:Uncharacterized protein LOC109716550 isoform X2 n=1 Tax=Ananas comosus TaxID=4615 RepID=A0A6P5FVW7_ANACO|nr:uncharacterized protein LOC109716550 isoform X2 [Ananas comosus]
MLFMEYFPDSDKRKMKEDFRKLRQGNCSVREYEREFTHLVNCVPGMVHTDRDRAEYFERELRPDIFRTVNALKLKTFEEVLDRALWVERGNAIARDERESFEKEREREKGKKRTTSGAGGQSSSKRPPRYPRSQSRYQGPPRCVICGGNHRPSACSQREGKCYKCGQPGHIIRDCPRGASSAQSTASVQSPQRQRVGLPPAMSAGRTFVPRQYEPPRPAPSTRMDAPRPAPSGRVFAAQTEDPAVVDDVVAGSRVCRGGDRLRPLEVERARRFPPVDFLLTLDERSSAASTGKKSRRLRRRLEWEGMEADPVGKRQAASIEPDGHGGKDDGERDVAHYEDRDEDPMAAAGGPGVEVDVVEGAAGEARLRAFGRRRCCRRRCCRRS